MTIKEVEQQTGLTRSNIRFYEKENLIRPARNTCNGYRDYSKEDVAALKKIVFLRTLAFSIDDIRNLADQTATLTEKLREQKMILNTQAAELKHAKIMCERLLRDTNVSYEELQVEKYIDNMESYCYDNRQIFELDSVTFLFIWGSLITWIFITGLCLGIGILFYHKLPDSLPVQWSDGKATSFVNKIFIFAYPAACILIRYLLRPIIYMKLQVNPYDKELITEYLANYLCFIALSIELFSILFLWEIVENVTVLLLIDTVVLLGLLLIGLHKKWGCRKIPISSPLTKE